MRVTLTKPHRHRGRDYPAGAALTLADHKAQWLVDIGTAQRQDEPAPAPAPKSAKGGKE